MTSQPLAPFSNTANVPKGMVRRKPPNGAPCNGCGVCCFIMLCPIARAVFDREAFPGPCPAMFRLDGEHWGCGMIIHPRKYVPNAPESDAVLAEAAKLLLVNGGCDARINGEPRDPIFNAKVDHAERNNPGEYARAKTIWGVKP